MDGTGVFWRMSSSAIQRRHFSPPCSQVRVHASKPASMLQLGLSSSSCKCRRARLHTLTSASRSRTEIHDTNAAVWAQVEISMGARTQVVSSRRPNSFSTSAYPIHSTKARRDMGGVQPNRNRRLGCLRLACLACEAALCAWVAALIRGPCGERPSRWR